MYKILVIGDFNSNIHEEAISNALIEKGNKVDKFSFSKYYGSIFLIKKFYHLQIRFRFGPFIYLINNALLKMLSNNYYDFIFFYRPIFINERVFQSSSINSKLFIYNNDDPFGSNYPKLFWKKYFIGLKYAHRIFYYREKNMLDYKQIGFDNTTLLRSYFIKDLNFPIQTTSSIYESDVSFIGHFENDGRDLILKHLINGGIDLKIFGPEWNNSEHYSYLRKKVGEIVSLKADYNIAINSTKIALVFFSKLNNDSYTRRCFEIPATKTFMLCEYSEEMSELFKEDEEIVFFKNKEELLCKVKFYLKNNDLRNQIALAAYNRLLKDKHEVKDRVDVILREYQLFKK